MKPIALALLLVGCATPPVAMKPVTPAAPGAQPEAPASRIPTEPAPTLLPSSTVTQPPPPAYPPTSTGPVTLPDG